MSGTPRPQEWGRLPPPAEPGLSIHHDPLHGEHVRRFLTRAFGLPDPGPDLYRWSFHLRHQGGESLHLVGANNVWNARWTGGESAFPGGDWALDRLARMVQERESVRLHWTGMTPAERHDLLLQVRDWARQERWPAANRQTYDQLALAADRVCTHVLPQPFDPHAPARWPAFTYLPPAEKAALLRQVATWAQREHWIGEATPVCGPQYIDRVWVRGPWEFAGRQHKSALAVADRLDGRRPLPDRSPDR